MLVLCCASRPSESHAIDDICGGTGEEIPTLSGRFALVSWVFRQSRFVILRLIEFEGKLLPSRFPAVDDPLDKVGFLVPLI